MSEQGKLRAMEQQMQDQQRLAWAMLIVGIAVGLLGMHFIVSRPMHQELATLKGSLKTVQSQVDLLTQESVDSGYTTSLLSELRAQREHMAAAKTALNSWYDLNRTLIGEQKQNAVASTSLTQLTDLSRNLVAMQSTTEQAQSVFNTTQQFQQNVIEAGSKTPAARQSLEQMEALNTQTLAQKDNLAAVQSVIAEQKTLQANLLMQKDNLDLAMIRVEEVSNLSSGLIEAASQLDVAQRMSDSLIQLESTLAQAPVNSMTALENAQRLVEVSSVVHKIEQLPMAQQNALSSQQLAQSMVAQTATLADAAETLELIVDFQKEIGTRVETLDQLREKFFQLSILEKQVSESLKILQPLLELSNLKRLSPEDLRTAARSILRQRSADQAIARGVRQPVHGIALSAEADSKLSGDNAVVPQPVDQTSVEQPVQSLE